MKADLCLLLVALGLPVSCLGQQVRLMGQVMDSRASAGLAGATVLLKQDTVVVAGTAADRDGNFALPPVPLGIYLLETRFIGYGTKTMRYVATVNNPAPLRVLVPGFCPYADRGKPACVGGHTRHLLPIAYGLPSAQWPAPAGAKCT